MRGLRIVGLMVSFLLVISVCSGLAQEGVIKEIMVLGNERVEQGTILKEIGSKVGGAFSKELVAKDIKAIYGLGYFQDIQVDEAQTKEGVILTFVVIEKPFVADIVISGNEKLSQQELEGAIEIKRDSVLDMAKVRSSVQGIKKLYTAKRYFGSEVEYRVELGEKNKAVVFFDIVEEGVKGYLTRITFSGNKAFGARRLRSIMQTKVKGLTWWFSKAGNLETDILDVDINRIKSMYHDHGYVTVKVGAPEVSLSTNKKSIQISITIEEGDQYKLGSLDIEGDILTTKEALLKGLKSKVQKVYNASVVHKDSLWLTDLYGDQGYAYAEVSPLTLLDNEKKLVGLTFKIEKGVEVFLNRIEIAGNTKTRDKVIRRELKIAEGDRYNSSRLRKSRQQVLKTQYFKEADFAPSATENKELIDLDIRVEEQQMGKLEFGAGYSNQYGVLGMIGLSHGNLFGRGYKASIRADIGGRTDNFSVSFADPRLFDGPLAAGIRAYKQSTEYSTYDADAIGGTFSLGMQLTENIRGEMEYLFERSRIYNIDSVLADPLAVPPIEASGYQPGDYIYEEWKRGWNSTSKISLTFTRDTIDSIFNPTKGAKIWITGAFAGLGGDNYFYTVNGGASWFHTIIGDLVVNLRGGIGFIQAYNNNNKGFGVPLPERFFVGGGWKTMRGFEYGVAGPVDPDTQEPLGALNMVTFSTEFTYPLSKAIGLKLAVFYDVGKGFDNWNDLTPLRHAVGAGFRWYSPFGPIRVDWGYNLFPMSHRGEKSSVWDFSMGAMF